MKNIQNLKQLAKELRSIIRMAEDLVSQIEQEIKEAEAKEK